jgi:hypothetical protein
MLIEPGDLLTKNSPAIGKAAEPGCGTPAAIKLPEIIAGLRRGLARARSRFK